MKPTVATYRISKVFDAPLGFVFDWCTDFREDDSKMAGGSTRRHFLEKGKERVIWRVRQKVKGGMKEGVRAVWLHPPGSWHLDTCGDGREVGDYKLTRLGKNKTRLDMVFHVTYDDPRELEEKEKWEGEASAEWDAFRKYLEREYEESKR